MMVNHPGFHSGSLKKEMSLYLVAAAMAAEAVSAKWGTSFVPSNGIFMPRPRVHGMKAPVLRSARPRQSWTMAKKKDFDKKYDDAFDDFRTSGSMPDIPSLSEQYSAAASFARQSGIPVKGDEGFGKRITEEQQVLESMQKESMQNYQELKEELLLDTFFISSVIFSIMNLFLPESTVNSFVIGMMMSLPDAT